jgi:hypothetical protein
MKPKQPEIEGWEGFEAEEDYNHWKKIVCDTFIKCLIEHDAEGIMRLAKAADFFKDKLDSKSVPADPLRQKLLRLKYSVVYPLYSSYCRMKTGGVQKFHSEKVVGSVRKTHFRS